VKQHMIAQKRVSTHSVKDKQIVIDSMAILVCELCSHLEPEEVLHLEQLVILQAYLQLTFNIDFNEPDTEVDNGPTGSTELSKVAEQDEAELSLADDCERLRGELR